MDNLKTMTLLESVTTIDFFQARRLKKIEGEALSIAAEGIIRHLRACSKIDVSPQAYAIKEIIDDALNGIRHFD